MPEERKKVWVDEFQTRLSSRIMCYLIVFLIVLCNFLFVWKLVEEGPLDPLQQFNDMMRTYFPVFVCLIALLPVMVWDTVRFSHRLVGPIVRFRKTMQAIANGESVRPIKLRGNDYLTEMRDDFNKMLEELQKRGVPVLKPTDPAQNEGDPSRKTA